MINEKNNNSEFPQSLETGFSTDLGEPKYSQINCVKQNKMKTDDHQYDKMQKINCQMHQ